jgi:hypothetical protein
LTAGPAELEASAELLDLVTRALDALERDAGALGIAIAKAMMTGVAPVAAAAGHEPGLPARLAAISEQSVRTLVTVTREARDPTDYELAFIHEVAIRRAADAFPLEALLHGLRVGQRLIWEHVVSHIGDDPLAPRAILELTARTLSYTDALSSAMAATYANTQETRAADHERRKTELLEEILSGRFPYQPDTPSRLAAAGLDPEEDCVVAIAVELDSRAPSDALTRARIRDAVERQARHRGARFLVIARDADVIAILAPPAGAREIIQAALADLGPPAGNTIAVGISETCPRLGDAARGNVEALRALTLVRQTGGIAALPEIRLFDYLAANADSVARRQIPRSAQRLTERKGGGEPLTETLRAYLDSDTSVPVTAARLSVHPNTVRYRLEKIEQLTGLDTRRFWDLAELAAILRIVAP